MGTLADNGCATHVPKDWNHQPHRVENHSISGLFEVAMKLIHLTLLPTARSGRFAAVLSAAMLLAACSHGPAKSAAKPKAAPPASLVVTNGNVIPAESLAGIIAPFENVAIQSSLTEPTDAVYVNEGDHVRVGQTLAALNTDDLRASLAADIATVQSNASTTEHTVYAGKLAISQGVNGYAGSQAAVVQARQTLARDQLDLDRYQQLFAHGYVPQQQVATQETLVRNDRQAIVAAQATLQSAQATVQQNGNLQNSGLESTAIAQARATVAQAQAQANEERVQIAKAIVVSPIDGFIVNRNLNPGEYPGSRQIFTLQQVDPIYAVLHGSGAQIASIAVGDSVRIAASDLRNAPFSGRVIGILNQITPGSTDFEVKVQLRNAQYRLRPGMAVVGTIALAAVSGPRIPISSFNDSSHQSVTTEDAHGNLAVVTVVDEAENADFAIISGLKAGTRIVRNPQSVTTSSGS
jgi:multidrug efflux pump subunit AcrA (membrane-fusion protein)